MATINLGVAHASPHLAKRFVLELVPSARRT